MITLIHGDDTGASRNFLFEQKRRAENVINLDGEKITLTDLIQEFEGGGLFVEKRTIIIENLLSKRKTSKEKDALILATQEKTLEHEIILWESKDLDKRAINKLGHVNVKQFKIPQTIFLFLDSLKPRNGPELVRLFHKALANSEPEMIFFMMVRQFRLLLALSEKSKAQIDEVKRLAPWQLGKLQKQSQAFEQTSLINLYTALGKIDKGYKTGNLNLPLDSAIDIFLLGI